MREAAGGVVRFTEMRPGDLRKSGLVSVQDLGQRAVVADDLEGGDDRTVFRLDEDSGLGFESLRAAQW